jgi:hypothetical protein
MRHVCGGDYYFGPRDIDRVSQGIKLSIVAWMEAQLLKEFENAIIHS